MPKLILECLNNERDSQSDAEREAEKEEDLKVTLENFQNSLNHIQNKSKTLDRNTELCPIHKGQKLAYYISVDGVRKNLCELCLLQDEYKGLVVEPLSRMAQELVENFDKSFQTFATNL